jgi:hypothetical protein
LAQAPQSARSEEKSRQEPEQSLSPAWQLVAQTPAEHTSPEAQALAHVPQWAGSADRFRQEPSQSVRPFWHESTQPLAEQT